MSSMTSETEWNNLLEQAATGDSNAVWNVMAARQDGDYELTPMETFCFSQLVGLAETSAALVRAASSLSRDMERAVAHVEGGMSVNQLGEVQGRGNEVDRYCALRYEQATTCRSLIAQLVKD